MERSKSLLWQITGCRVFFVFLLLAASGILGDEDSTLPSQEPAMASAKEVSVNETLPADALPSTALPSKEVTAKDTGSDVSPGATTVLKPLVAISSNDETLSKSTLSVAQPSTVKHSEPDTAPEQTEPATLGNKTKQANPETSTKVAATLAETEPTKVVHKTSPTVKVLTASNKTATTVRSTGLIPRGSKGKKEISTTPGHDDLTTHADTSSRRPESQSTTVTSIIKVPESHTTTTTSPSKGSKGVTGASSTKTPESRAEPTSSPSKGSRGVTVAIVLSVLLLLVLLIAAFYCWRRRHSGSTSFNKVGWAGQAALPDDSGLDKEVEEGPLTTGEGEKRRATLTTFLGKRQSRVPSVAMEEVVGKKTADVEEAQQLIDGDASTISSPEGPGEANGKLLETTKQLSQEFPPPPANQEGNPATP